MKIKLLLLVALALGNLCCSSVSSPLPEEPWRAIVMMERDNPDI